MSLSFEERASVSPFVERIWHSHSEYAGSFASIAAIHWEIVVTKYEGKTTLTVRVPETKATHLEYSAGAEWFGIDFKLGTYMPHFPPKSLVDFNDVNLPDASSHSFWLQGSAWQFPTYENYEAFAEVWPTRAGADEIADRINSLPKFVASRTLQGPLEWNAALIKGDVAEEVAKLKQQPGQDILQYGIGELTHTLMQHGLVDEFHFLLFPVVVGSGERIFEKIDQTSLKLLEAKAFDTGVVALRYQPQRKE